MTTQNNNENLNKLYENLHMKLYYNYFTDEYTKIIYRNILLSINKYFNLKIIFTYDNLKEIYMKHHHINNDFISVLINIGIEFDKDVFKNYIIDIL